MANHIINDKGQTVIVIGALGSVARAQAEWPALIDRVRGHYEAFEDAPSHAVDRAVEMIRAANITDEVKTLAILEAAGYSEQQPAMETVRRVTRRQ